MKIKFFILIVILLSFSQSQAARTNNIQDLEDIVVAGYCLDAAGSWTDATLHPDQCIGAVYGELDQTNPINGNEIPPTEYVELEEQTSSLRIQY